MSMPADLVALIDADSPPATPAGNRVYPMKTPSQVFDGEDRRPCIVYRTSGVLRDKTFCATNALVSEQFTFTCYALTYDGAKALADALIALLLDLHAVSGSTHIEAVSLVTEFDLVDFEPGVYGRALIFDVRHRSN